MILIVNNITHRIIKHYFHYTMGIIIGDYRNINEVLLEDSHYLVVTVLEKKLKSMEQKNPNTQTKI